MSVKADVYCYVGFVAPFSEEQPDGDAAGRDLAEYIAAAFERAGYEPGRPLDVQFAWELWPNVNGHEIRTLVGHVGDVDVDPPRQWLITNDVRFGVIERLFRPSRIRSKIEALRSVSSTLHRALTEDPRFSSIRWHNASTIDLPGSQERDSPM